MFACRIPLKQPRDCSQGSSSCDCSYGAGNPAEEQAAADAAASPLCQQDDKDPYGSTQFWAKAYPGSRFVEVAYRLQETSILTSICTPNVTEPDRADFGYRPAVDALIGKIRPQRKPAP
jgi:hypothetical protein